MIAGSVVGDRGCSSCGSQRLQFSIIMGSSALYALAWGLGELEFCLPDSRPELVDYVRIPTCVGTLAFSLRTSCKQLQLCCQRPNSDASARE